MRAKSDRSLVCDLSEWTHRLFYYATFYLKVAKNAYSKKSTDNQDLSIAEGDNLLYDIDTLEPRETGQWLIAQNSAFCQCQHGPDGKIVFNLGQDTSENDSNQAKRLTSPSKDTSDLSNDSEDEVLLINTQNSCKGEGGDSPRWYSPQVGEILKKTTSLIRDKLATIINKLGFSD